MASDREELAKALNGHHVTRGMQVASGVTCECCYWTGSEPEIGKRPMPWGRDQLDLHRADAVLASDWLAEHDANLRERVGEEIALEIESDCAHPKSDRYDVCRPCADAAHIARNHHKEQR